MTDSNVQATYRSLQESSAQTISSAVTRSAQLYQNVVNPVEKSLPIRTAAMRKPNLAFEPREKLSTDPVAPLLGGGTQDAQFLCLVAELMKPSGKD
jgi:hypothetical protein